jgi:hypothetical protein
MTSRKLIPLILMLLLLALCAGVQTATADSSHARIIRLSLVQGDVRFARETHGDPLADSNASWETAETNLPIRQGYVLATDNGRAEVEFENGAMAFLKEDTILEFYDLSLNDGGRTTRLVLRQGSASFYFNPASGDYFSVTGGDFTAEANGRTSFRVDNYDDSSSVEVLKGHLNVLHDKKTTRLDKGQSLSMKAGNELSVSIGRVPDEDDFDRWVSGRVDTISTANTAALQYTDSSYYAPGFASLYSYGSWASCGGYGFGWRPFGVGLGWSPFTAGQWMWDTGYGWTFMSSQPWGWAPYHYGGWLFDASCGGWFYSPPAFYGYPGYPGGPRRVFPKGVHPPQPVYHPSTAVFVRQNGKVGIVPMHPLDKNGKPPLNLEHGVFSPLPGRGMSESLQVGERGQKWEPLKSAPRDALSNTLAPAAPPVRVSRTVLEGSSGARVVSLSKDSSIAYDPKEHRFVNTNNASASESVGQREIRVGNEKPAGAANSTASANARTPAVPPTARNSMPPVRNVTPPPAPRNYGGERGSSGNGGSTWSGSRSSGTSGSSGHSSPAPAPAPAPRSSGGGKPH